MLSFRTWDLHVNYVPPVPLTPKKAKLRVMTPAHVLTLPSHSCFMLSKYSDFEFEDFDNILGDFGEHGF